MASQKWLIKFSTFSLFFLIESEILAVPIPKEHHNVEYKHSCVADILQIGWETNATHAECGQPLI